MSTTGSLAIFYVMRLVSLVCRACLTTRCPFHRISGIAGVRLLEGLRGEDFRGDWGMIEFSCDCGKSYVVKDESAGRRGQCKECGAPLAVPTKGSPLHGKPPTPVAEMGAAGGAGPGGPMPWDEGPEKKLAKLTRKCGASPIYLLVAARRFFTGEGSAEFREDTLRVRGVLGVAPFHAIVYWIIAVLIGNFVVTLIPTVLPIRAVMLWGPFVFNIVCVGYLVFQFVAGREMKSIFVRPEKVKSVVCEGPVVTIKCRVDLADELNAIRIFVSPGFRLTFFREFDKMFPEKLPDNYRAAAQRIRGAGADEV